MVLTLPRPVKSMQIASGIVLLNSRGLRHVSADFHFPLVKGCLLCTSGLSLHMSQEGSKVWSKRKQGDKQCLTWGMIGRCESKPPIKTLAEIRVPRRGHTGKKRSIHGLSYVILTTPYSTHHHPHLITKRLRPRELKIICPSSHSKLQLVNGGTQAVGP